MKLICEELRGTTQIITEADASGNKKLYIEGIFLQADIVNKNKRLYPEKLMEKEVSRYIKESVDTGTAYGMLNHPETPEMDLNQVSHRIISLIKEDSNWVGKAIVATSNNPGKVIMGLFEIGANLGVSSRGLGSLKSNSNGINEVQEDFRLITAADVVANPSAPNAWVNGILENVEYFYDEKFGYKALELVDAQKKYAKENYKSLDEAKMLNMFENYLKLIV